MEDLKLVTIVGIGCIPETIALHSGDEFYGSGKSISDHNQRLNQSKLIHNKMHRSPCVTRQDLAGFPVSLFGRLVRGWLLYKDLSVIRLILALGKIIENPGNNWLPSLLSVIKQAETLWKSPALHLCIHCGTDNTNKLYDFCYNQSQRL